MSIKNVRKICKKKIKTYLKSSINQEFKAKQIHFFFPNSPKKKRKKRRFNRNFKNYQNKHYKQNNIKKGNKIKKEKKRVQFNPHMKIRNFSSTRKLNLLKL